MCNAVHDWKKEDWAKQFKVGVRFRTNTILSILKSEMSHPRLRFSSVGASAKIVIRQSMRDALSGFSAMTSARANIAARLRAKKDIGQLRFSRWLSRLKRRLMLPPLFLPL
jgi:hypothetical protein